MPWRKVLYEDQGYPDNYVDSSFLEQMQKNLNTRSYDYWNTVYESGAVTDHISATCLFVVTFVYLEAGVLSPKLLILLTVASCFLGYIAYAACAVHLGETVQKSHLWIVIRSAVVFLLFTFSLSPILYTLTESVSTDTIYAMTVFMFLGNILVFDYGTTAAIVSESMSFNLAMFGSMCLASRLTTVLHTFSIVSFAVEVFALWPELRRKVQATHRGCKMGVSCGSVLASVYALWTVSTVAAVLLGSVHFVVTFLCPRWLIQLQPYKNNIQGPWDEVNIVDKMEVRKML
ncbi:phosphatidylinositol N-acetylglucosaminyltransferase subunit C-like isoform X1 [Branchiostoma floridae]|uniref:Phosphatidylinositol N-acetylglucosaminyltransferase subunit C-like isoform X1 n=1 Tax=Branchiostoma floridae TaxID=7739 RepID=A0A9J7LLU6_BRAFL|nr:phosphatidylinositol N-acetylglucosaminyltransferase subunit C-like isoform X1 [Branchiostoma floridae]